VKPAPFDYVRARSHEHALEVLAGGEAKLIAGGQSLLPMMNLRLTAVERLVDIDGLSELDRVLGTGEELLIGALVRHDRLVRDPLVRRSEPLLAEAATHIGHVAIRNRGTIGGSLAHADPTAELPAACITLDARIVCARADGRRREVPAAAFFLGRYETVLEPDEMIAWIRIPRTSARAGWGFSEVAPREGDFAWAGACSLLQASDDDAAVLRAVVFGVEPTPRTFEASREQWRQDPDTARRWAEQLQPTVEPEFRRDLAAEMVRRATAAAQRRFSG
jgi:aerobic carbon-monoxide dehydrogenase medium subunit